MTKVYEKKYEKNTHIFFEQEKDLIAVNFFSPTSINDYVGQEELKKRLDVYIESAKKRRTALDHMLFFGPPGLGKTTLAEIIACELKKKIKTTSGPILQKPGDLLALLSSLQEGDLFFIDEIHRLPMIVEEALYSAMEQYKIDIIIGAGAGSKTVTISLPPFTLLAATTKLGLLSAPLRSRFGIIERFDWYTIPELTTIVMQTAMFFGITIDSQSAKKVAEASRGTPRIAKKLMHKIRDYSIVKTNKIINESVILEVFSFFNILENGLMYQDILLLRALYDKNHPIGIELLAALINEEVEAIEEVYEPFLLRLGYIERTPKGRVLRKEKKDEIEKILYKNKLL
jgi:Holliday junction DNA helicase RuvB